MTSVWSVSRPLLLAVFVAMLAGCAPGSSPQGDGAWDGGGEDGRDGAALDLRDAAPDGALGGPRDGGGQGPVDGFRDGFVDGDEPLNRIDGGVPGGCNPGGWVLCPESPSACRRCAREQCQMEMEYCDNSLACVYAVEDFFHCRSDGSLAPFQLITCLALNPHRCNECFVLGACNE